MGKNFFVILLLMSLISTHTKSQDTCMFLCHTFSTLILEENKGTVFISAESEFYPFSKILPKKIKKDFVEIYDTDSSLYEYSDFSCDCYTKQVISSKNEFRKFKVKLTDSVDCITDSIDNSYRDKHTRVIDSLWPQYQDFIKTPEYIKLQRVQNPILFAFTGIFFIDNKYAVVGVLTFKQPYKCTNRSVFIYKNKKGSWKLNGILKHTDSNKINRFRLKEKRLLRKTFKY